MTNFTAVGSSSNYLTYDPATRLLSGCVTNSGAGSGFPLDADGDLAGYTLSNGVLSNVTYYGNGLGLTNVPGDGNGARVLWRRIECRDAR